MTAQKSSDLTDVGEKRIAAFAVENDHLYASLLTGRAVLLNGEYVFQYETCTDPQNFRLEDYLSEKDFGEKVGEFLTQFAAPRLDAVGISTYGALDTKDCIMHIAPSDGPEPEPNDSNRLNFHSALRGIIGNAKLAVENDATAAAIGEYWWGAGKRGAHLSPRSTFAYVWIGRGVNAGVVQDGIPLAERYRPETGHLRAFPYAENGVLDPIGSTCSRHEDCITGLAGLKAMLARLGRDDLSDEQAIDMTADYVAQLCATISHTVTPGQIAVGGLQMRMPWSTPLFERVKDRFGRYTSGRPFRQVTDDFSETLTRDKLGIRAAIMGAAESARREIHSEMKPSPHA